ITKPHVAPQRSRPRFEDAKPNEPTAKSNLSSAEIEARLRALEEAHIQERIIREQAEEEARRAKEREESLRQTIQKTEIDETPQEEEEPTLQTQTPSLSPAQSQIEPINIPITPKNTTVIEKRKADETKEDDRNSRRTNLAKSEVRAPKVLKGADEKRRGKITLNSALDEEGSARGRSMAAMRRRQEKFKRAQNQEPKEKISREVILPETITIQELAQRMTERSVDVIKFLMKQGQMMKPGDVIDADVAELIAVEFGHTVKRVLESDVEEGI
ncbi:translation initiation factor IF-2 N-terminal domain-containing protein, partial [Bartonella sp. AA2SXKL]